MTAPARIHTSEQHPLPPPWIPPEPPADQFTFRFASSLLDEFILSHSFDDVLRELVQNEYDAGGTEMSVSFDTDGLQITGNGKPIDAAGWKRLSVMLGTGTIIGDSQQIEGKSNGIGSKNQGLRSLFLFGDQIYIRSGGKQTILDLRKGTPPPFADPSSVYRRGVHISVPFRIHRQGKLEPFTSEREHELLDRIAAELASTLIKLANPGGKHGVTRVSVSSQRCHRRIEWRQSVKVVKTRGTKGTLLRRSIRTKDSGDGADRPARTQVIDELEFQRFLNIPGEFYQQNIPFYFVVPARRIKLALSFRLRGKRIDRSQQGRYFYPLGARDGSTGIALSVCAPFEMNPNRSDLVAASPWNRWLLDQASAVSQELLTGEWLERFGADAYLALFNPKPLPGMVLAQTLHTHLSEAACWPTRAPQTDPPKLLVFAKAAKLVVPDVEALDGLVGDSCYLDDRLGRSEELRKIVCSCGAIRFTVNSLVRLRCAGADAKVLKTRVKQGEEANYHYPNFPAGLKSPEIQHKLAVALDAVERRLSADHKADLRSTPTTLAADGNLAPLQSLQAITPEMDQISPVPPSQRLHHTLLASNVLVKLAQRPNPGAWVKDAAARATKGTIDPGEREVLYQYIIKHGTDLSREVRRALKNAPVLRDQHGGWSTPGQITVSKAKGADQIQAALHLPHPDYARDTALASALFFRKKIEGEDLVAYAQIVAREPQHAAGFERFLQRNSRLISEPVRRKLQSIAFLVSTKGGLAEPSVLYLPNDTNQACLGDRVAYPDGRATKLYEQLGCQLGPRSQDIVAYLIQLRGQGRGPARPEILYPELVLALKVEGKVAKSYETAAILWTGRGYYSPRDVLLGSKHRTIFQDSQPISDTTGVIAQAYRQLGAEAEPQAHHWLTLLAWHEQRIGLPPQTISREQQRALRQVYIHIPSGVLASIPPDRRWLLGRNGLLYSKHDITQHRLLLNDDPNMADAIAQQAAGISFFDTQGSQRLLQLARELRIMRVTEARQFIDIKIGELSSPLRELKVEQLLAPFGSKDLASAMHALVMHRYDDQLDPNIATSTQLAAKLHAVHEVVFSKDIRRSYRISGHLIEVCVEAAIKKNRLILVPIDTYLAARQLTAEVLAELFVAVPEQQRTLADAIFALLTCDLRRDIEPFMRRKGIPWSPSQSSLEDDNLDQKVVEQLSERLNQSETSADTTSGFDDRQTNGESSEVPGTDTAESGRDIPPSTPVPEQTPTDTPPGPPEPPLLPPLDTVKPRIVPASGTWSPNATNGTRPSGSSGRAGMGGGSHGSERRKREIGLRGEELVYRYEQDRVRQLGQPVERVRWIARDTPNANHDIFSVDDDGKDIWIEVKATTGADGRFEWSRAEFELARRKRQRYILWRVYEADTQTPTLRNFRDPIALFSTSSIDLDVGTLIVKVEPLG